MTRPEPVVPGPGQESVWDYPRPPRLEPDTRTVRIVFNGHVIAESSRAMRVVETGHPPTWYLPPDDVDMDRLAISPGGTACAWKGQARYFDIVVADRTAERAVFCYPKPAPAFSAIAGYLCFHALPMDEVTVDGIPVEPQPGGFYAGWITPDVVGPFTGGPDTWGW